jgi:DNA-binding CsgD family transcriptional regulator
MNDLTPREEQVLWLIARGITTPQIALKLFITEPTVRNHVQSILRKTETNNRLAAVYAWRHRKSDHAGRILDYCKTAKILLTKEQESEIRRMFAEPARCEDGSHQVPVGDTTCQCRALSVAVPQGPET